MTVAVEVAVGQPHRGVDDVAAHVVRWVEAFHPVARHEIDVAAHEIRRELLGQGDEPRMIRGENRAVDFAIRHPAVNRSADRARHLQAGRGTDKSPAGGN